VNDERVFDASEREAVELWFRDFTSWLARRQIEPFRRNNHGVFYHIQVLSLLPWVIDETIRSYILQNAAMYLGREQYTQIKSKARHGRVKLWFQDFTSWFTPRTDNTVWTLPKEAERKDCHHYMIFGMSSWLYAYRSLGRYGFSLDHDHICAAARFLTRSQANLELMCKGQALPPMHARSYRLMARNTEAICGSSGASRLTEKNYPQYEFPFAEMPLYSQMMSS